MKMIISKTSNLKRILLTLMTGFYFQHSTAQNLVTNWSFEDTVMCPPAINSVYAAIGWSTYNLSPDYFHSCNVNLAGVPSNFTGYQFARTGVAYTGLVTYATGGVNAREMIGC